MYNQLFGRWTLKPSSESIFNVLSVQEGLKFKFESIAAKIQTWIPLQYNCTELFQINTDPQCIHAVRRVVYRRRAFYVFSISQEHTQTLSELLAAVTDRFSHTWLSCVIDELSGAALELLSHDTTALCLHILWPLYKVFSVGK